MKQHFNPILRTVESRIRQLVERYQESLAIPHSATKGSLREGYLKQFLAEFVPSSLQIRSGFVTDCRGLEISPQIDLLIFDPSSLPAISMDAFVTLLPIEAVRLSIEVKSTITKPDIEQVQLQQEIFRKMRYSFTTSKREYLTTVDCAGIPQFIVSFDSECSRETIREWFNVESSLTAVCVIGKFFAGRDFRSNAIEIIEGDSRHTEIMQFLSAIRTQLDITKLELRDGLKQMTPDGELDFSPDIGSYLTFDVPYPENDKE